MSPTMRMVVLTGGAVAATGLLAVLAAGPARAAPVRGLSAAVVALAKKWAKTRGLPPHWVLATIVIESRGNPHAHRVSSREDSYGLMQVNARAHAARLEAAGTAPTDLYDPDTNLKWGTLILREAYDRAVQAGSRHPIDLATRLVYNIGHLPAAAPSDKVVAWSEALARTRALV